MERGKAQENNDSTTPGIGGEREVIEKYTSCCSLELKINATFYCCFQIQHHDWNQHMVSSSYLNLPQELIDEFKKNIRSIGSKLLRRWVVMEKC